MLLQLRVCGISVDFLSTSARCGWLPLPAADVLALCTLASIFLFLSVPAVPLKYKLLGAAFQSWGWVQAAAFYGIVPVVLYIGAKNSGFTSVWDFKKAFMLPLT